MPLQGDITGASIVVAGTTIEQNLATLLSTFGSGGSTGVFESGTLFPTLVPGTNITMSGTSPNLTISATGGSGGSSGIVELLQGTLASTGTATVGLGLSLAGATNPTLANSGLLDLSGTTGHITLGTNLTMSGQTLTVNQGLAEIVSGSSIGTGNVTLGTGLTLTGTTNPTLANSGVVSFGGDSGAIVLGPSLAMTGQTLNVNGIGAIQAVVGGAAQVASTLNAGPNITLSGTSPQVTISASGGASAALVVENQGTSLGSATTLNSSAPVTIALASSIASVGVNAVSVSSGAASAGALVQLNASGDVDVSMMPFGAGALTLAPLGTNVSVLGYVNNSGTTNLSTVANRQSFVPFVVSKPTVINNLGCIVNTGLASTTFSVGIYADNGNSGGTGNLPSGSPLVSVSGLSSATAGAVLGSVGTPYMLQPNTVYWRSFIQSTAVSMKVIAIGGETGALGVGSAGAVVTGYYLSGSGTTLISPFSGTPSSSVTTAWPLMIYS